LKAEQLASAGISTSTAQRYEEIAGGKVGIPNDGKPKADQLASSGIY